MSKTMNVNYMTRVYNSLLQNYETKNTDTESCNYIGQSNKTEFTVAGKENRK